MYDEDVTEAVVLAIHNRRQRVLAAALAVLPREASAEGARKFRVPPPPPNSPHGFAVLLSKIC